MFEFTPEEKKSILFVIDNVVGNYKSDAIYKRIENDKLTKSDLKALDSKARQLLHWSQHSEFAKAPEGVVLLLTSIRNASVVLDALSRYRSDDFNPDKIIDNYMKRRGS